MGTFHLAISLTQRRPLRSEEARDELEQALVAEHRHVQERALLSHGRDFDGRDLHVWRQRRGQQKEGELSRELGLEVAPRHHQHQRQAASPVLVLAALDLRGVGTLSEAVSESGSVLILGLLAQARIGGAAVDLQWSAPIIFDCREVCALGAKKKADMDVSIEGGQVKRSSTGACFSRGRRRAMVEQHTANSVMAAIGGYHQCVPTSCIPRVHVGSEQGELIDETSVPSLARCQDCRVSPTYIHTVIANAKPEPVPRPLQLEHFAVQVQSGEHLGLSTLGCVFEELSVSHLAIKARPTKMITRASSLESPV